ncbi:MAG: hypothetical protein R3B70_34695 [Polyangiaceae bacterium]
MGGNDDKTAILLLERDTEVIEIAQAHASEDTEIHVANTLDLALRIAARRPPSIAVLDAGMIGHHSVDAVFKLRALAPGIRFVFLALPALDLDRRCGQFGPVLRKPITAERFADALRYVQRLRGMSAGVARMRGSSGTFPAVRPHDPSPFDRGARPLSTHPPSLERADVEDDTGGPSSRPHRPVRSR